MTTTDLAARDSSDAVSASYPEGPYGEVVGATLDDLAFTTRAGEVLKLSDVRSQSDKRFILLAATATWCTSCGEEMKRLDDVRRAPEGAELEVLVAIFEDGSYQPATAETAERWRTQYEFDLEVVADPRFTLGRYYDANATPMFMLVERSTMTIRLVVTGLKLDEILAAADFP